MNEKQIINYAEFLNNNLEQLKINYKTSYEFIYKSSFFEYCNQVVDFWGGWRDQK